MMGYTVFNQMASEYLTTYPPNNVDISAIGYALPEFFLKNSQWKNKRYHQATLLEWTASRLFVAAEQPALDPNTLNPEQIQKLDSLPLRFQPHVSFFSEDWNLVEQHLLVKDDQDDKLSVTLRKQTTLWIIFRHGTTIRMEPITPFQDQLLKTLGQAESLQSAVETAFATVGESRIEDIAPKLQMWFSTWISWGIMVSPL